MVVITEIHSPHANYVDAMLIGNAPSFEVVETRDHSPTTVEFSRGRKLDRQWQHIKAPYCRSDSSSSNSNDSPRSCRRMRSIVKYNRDTYVDSNTSSSSIDDHNHLSQESNAEHDAATALASMATQSYRVQSRSCSPFSVQHLLSDTLDEDDEATTEQPSTIAKVLVNDHFETARLAYLQKGRRYSSPDVQVRGTPLQYPTSSQSFSRHMSFEQSSLAHHRPGHQEYPQHPRQQPVAQRCNEPIAADRSLVAPAERVTSMLEHNLVSAAKVGMQMPPVRASHRALFASAFAGFF